MTPARLLATLLLPFCILRFPSAAAISTDPVVELRRVPNDGIQPEIAVDSDGVLHMLYFAGEPRAGDLFYVRSRDFGATFTRPLRVNSQAGSAIAAGTIRGGQFALGRGGRVHVVWNGSEIARPEGPPHRETGRPGMPLLYTRSTPDASAFEPQRNLMRHTWALDGGGTVTADQSGRVHVAWHAQSGDETAGNEGTRRVWIAGSSDDGATFEAERAAWAAPTGACGCCGMRAFTASTGKLFVLFRSATEIVNRDIHLLTSNDGGRSFSGARVHPWTIASCPMTSMSFVESGGRILGAWETAGQVYFRALDDARDGAPSAPEPSAAGRKHPRLAATAKGDLLLVWSEGTAWARGGAVGWQRFDRSGRQVGPAGSQPGVPVWSFATAVARRDAGFMIFY